jgi:hypothetical protein
MGDARAGALPAGSDRPILGRQDMAQPVARMVNGTLKSGFSAI